VLAHFRQLGEADEKLACPIDDLFLGVGNIISIVKGIPLDRSDGQSALLGCGVKKQAGQWNGAEQDQ